MHRFLQRDTFTGGDLESQQAYQSKSGESFVLEQVDLGAPSGVLDEYARFFIDNGDFKAVPSLRWLHASNPAGHGLASIATKDGRWAALYAVTPVGFQIGRRRMMGTQSLDTLTDADFRGAGLSPASARHVYAAAANTGAALVYGFPNAISGPMLFRKVDWVPLDPVPFLVKPLRLRYAFDRLLRRFRKAPPEQQIPTPVPLREIPLRARDRAAGIERLTAFDDSATALWERFADASTVGVRRDATYLNWRLIQKPAVEYDVRVIRRGDAVQAVVATAAYRKHGGTIGYILELLHDAASRDAGLSLLRSATASLKAAGCDAVLAWCQPHSSNRSTYRRAGFWSLPERLRPIELHAGVCVFDESVRSAVTNRANWYFSYLDSDTV